METLEQFANNTATTPPKSYGNFNGGFVGECVSYVQQYMIRCLGISPGGWGNAVDYWTKPNPNFAKHFTRIGADKPMQDGDIIVWQGDARSGVSHYGHIAIAYKGQVLQQNWSGRYVTINNMFTAGLLGYWRPKNKGGEEMINDKDNEFWRWQKLGYQIRGRNLSRAEFREAAVGRTWLKALEILSDDDEANTATWAQEVGQYAIANSWEDLIKSNHAALAAEREKSVGLVKNVSDLTARLQEAKGKLAAFEAEAAEPDLVAKAQAEIDRLEAELAAAEKKIKLLEADKLKPTQPVEPVAPDKSTPPTETQTPTLSEVLIVFHRWLVSFIKRN